MSSTSSLQRSTPSKKKRRLPREQPTSGLSLSQQKQLAQDLEARGGIDGAGYSFKYICDRKPHFYGASNSDQRRKFQNLHNEWKNNWDRADYYQLCADLGVATARQNQQTPDKTISEAPEAQIVASIPNSISSPIQHKILPSSISSPSQPKVKFTASSENMSQLSFYRKKLPKGKHDFPCWIFGSNHYSQIYIAAGQTVVIEPVNLAFPERNGEVMVVPFTDKNLDGTLHNGCEIRLRCDDARDFFLDNYDAYITGEREISMVVPAYSKFFFGFG